ncbi:MAG TPA: hypothetical protein VE258_15965, partial [Ktedonobacterales bacterium]|nr:hypothetical protein [Ktedonobacterales bacterium]
RDIDKALRLAQVPAPTTLHLLAVMPTIVETAAATAEAIRSTLAAGERPVVNLTGGTKLMSIGAFDAARTAGVSSVYVDTGRQQFIDGGTGAPIDSLVNSDLTFEPIKSKLKVNVIAVANGLERVTNSKKWSTYVPLARHLLTTPKDEDQCWGAMRDKNGGLVAKGEPDKWAGWSTLSNKPFDLPPAVAHHAAEAGLIEPSGTKWTLPTPDKEKIERLAKSEVEGQRRLKGPLAEGERVNVTNRVGNLRKDLSGLIERTQFSLNILSGGWLEVALADVANESGHFEDLRWSVQTGGRGWGEEEEQDLIGVQGAQLALFSCKRGGARAKLASELEIIQARARFVGGALTRRYLCVGRMTSDAALRHALQRRARELGIGLITARMLRERAPFWEAAPEA